MCHVRTHFSNFLVLGDHFKSGQRDWPSRTENVLPCRLLWWQVSFGAPAPRTAFEHMTVVQ